MGTCYWVADLPSKRYVDIDKAYDLSHAMDALGLAMGEPVLTAEILATFLVEHPDEAPRIEPVLRWQREACEGRPLSLWHEHMDDRPWIDWDGPNYRRPDWTEDDVVYPRAQRYRLDDGTEGEFTVPTWGPVLAVEEVPDGS